MKTTLQTLIISLIATLVNAQAPKTEWTKAIGGTGNERANSITTDSKGNIIVAGRFQSSVIVLDGITLKKNTADPVDAADIFIIKLDKSGKALWAVTAGYYGDDHALSCITDKKGNIYVTGYFESETLKFGNISMNNNNFTAGKDSVKYNSDMYIAKFSPQGKCIWAKNAGGEGANGQYSTISLDKQNNVIVAGIAGNTMNFGNGIKLTSEKGGMYIAKYTNDGNLMWAKGASNGECQGVSTDNENNVFAGGYFKSKTSFDGIELTSNGNSDAYIAKFDPQGKVLWAKNFGGEGGEIASCETDPFGNVYLAGMFFSKSIATDNTTLTNKGLTNAFIAKFDKNGKLLWAKSAGGNNGDEPATATREFHVDKNGNAYCTGSNWSEFTFSGQTIKTVAGSEDIFLLKYDTNGNERWGIDYGGLGRNAGRGITTDKYGHIFLTGSFDEKTLNIDNQVLTNLGDSDIFIIKLSEQKKKE